MGRALGSGTLLVLLLLDPGTVAQTVVDPQLRVDDVVSGVGLSTTLAFIGDDDFLVLQKETGRVRRVLGGTLLPAPVLDVNVHFQGERGLLGIAPDPGFVNNRHVYLYYTESPAGDTFDEQVIPLGNRVYRYTWDGSALVAPELILDLPVTPGPAHNGGIIAFGPDDRLHAVVGDLGRSGQLENVPAGPEPDDTAVILRITSAGAALPDNPFFDPTDASNPLNRYLAYGVRNSFGMAFDPVTGDLWSTENGPNSYDEVNRVEPGTNSGWRQIMGPDSRDPQNQGDLWLAPGATYSDPEFSWSTPVGPTAVLFVKSPKLGCDLLHDALVADFNCGQIYHFELNGARDAFQFQDAELQDLVADNTTDPCATELGEPIFGVGFNAITDMKTGPDGRIYVLRILDGRVMRIGPEPGAVTDVDGDEVDDACDCDPSDPAAFGTPLEVPSVRVSGVPTNLGWDSQSVETGDGTVHDVVSGELSLLLAEAGFDSACTLAAGVMESRVTDARADPPAGDGYFYLVRARNSCADGTFGDGTDPANARGDLDLLPPSVCP